MTSIKLTVTGAEAWASVTGILTSGMVGIPVTIEYDEAWDGLTKNLMCRCSPWGSDDGEIRTRLNVGEVSTVAHEVMQPDMYLYLGVEGFSADGTLVIPTAWAKCGKIEYGANTCEDPSTDPELTVWNQIQAEMEQIRQDVIPPELVAEIKGYAQSATKSATNAERAKDQSVAASNEALSNAAAARYAADTAQESSDSARTSASSAANLANGALQAQRAAEAAAERAEAAADSVECGALVAAQINALDGMFRVAAYNPNAEYAAAYAAFCAAFGLAAPDDGGGSEGGDTGGDNTGGSNESTWTDGVAYTYAAVENEYVDTNGAFTAYSGWNRTPYLYCKGAAVLRVVVNNATSLLGSNNHYNAFYDVNKNFVGAFDYGGIDCNTAGAYKDIEIPTDAAYFVASHKGGVIGSSAAGLSFVNAVGFVPYSEVPV